MSEEPTDQLQYHGEDEPGPDANKAVQIPIEDASDPFPDRVQNPDKASYMAMYGSVPRERAAGDRSMMADPESKIWKHFSGLADGGGSGRELMTEEEKRQYLSQDAKESDIRAEEAEEIAGRRYDEQEPASQELQAEILERMAKLLKTHQISEAYRKARLAEGSDVTSAQSLLALGLRAHKAGMEFDRLKYDDPDKALELLEEAKAFVRIIADIENGTAADPNYQLIGEELTAEKPNAADSGA